MKTPILCRLGLHKRQSRLFFEPSINAEIVEAFVLITWCPRCGKTLEEKRNEWDGEVFKTVAKEPNE